VAILEVREIWNGRTGSENDKAVRNYTRVYRVITSSPLVGSLAVRYAPDIPRRFDAYVNIDGSFDTEALVKKVTEKQEDEDPNTWLVTVEYSSSTEDPDYGKEEPLDRPSEINWGSTKVHVPAVKDIFDEAIVNSADDPFNPPIEEEQCRVTLQIVKNQIAFDGPNLGTFVNHVSSAPFFGFDTGEVKCVGIGAQRQYERGQFFWKVTYDFECRPGEGLDAWSAVVLDRGFNQLEPFPKGRTPIRDKVTGAQFSTPTLLDGTGQILDQDADPVYLTFVIYPTADFNQLRLP
jgi:hypothetical protein